MTRTLLTLENLAVIEKEIPDDSDPKIINRFLVLRKYDKHESYEKNEDGKTFGCLKFKELWFTSDDYNILCTLINNQLPGKK